MNRCPRCNCEAIGQNRLVTDSCGHSKCRLCLLADVSDCLECKAKTQLPSVGRPESKPDVQLGTKITSNHIKSTTQGYFCSVCNRSFRSRTQQYYHIACGNEKLKKYHCAQCPRRFATRSHLKYHQNSHEKNPIYSCSICSKSFKQQSLLQRHVFNHNSPNIACQKCPRLFRTDKALAAHGVLHSGNSLPFKCDVCSKQYLTKANLKQHQLRHDQNGARHKCNVCNKSFLRSSTLRLHQKRHTKRPRHACSQCYKTFNDVDALTRHSKQHMATHRYRCLQCEVTVNRRDNMQRHMRTMHPDVPFEAGVKILEVLENNVTMQAPAETSTSNFRYNSVIKSVGNVEPVLVTISQEELGKEKPMALVPAMPDKMQNENVKLYRKIILDLDNEEYSNELSIGLDMEPATSVTEQQTNHHVHPQNESISGQRSSNFRHWRKNFKNVYENEHTN